MIERDHDADRPAEVPVTVRLAPRGHGPDVVVVLIAVFVALAIVKPWDHGPAAPRPTPRLTAAPVAAPSIDPLDVLRANCQEPPGWRIYSRERWAKLVVRSWKTVDPGYGASGPLDPEIPFVPLPAQIDALGYCSPWTGDERPPADAVVSAWRITLDRGYGTEPSAEMIRLQPADPGWPSELGALYGPPVNRFDPSAIETLGWPGGRYVFAIRAPGFARWWGTDVVPPTLVTRVEGPSASPRPPSP